MWCGQAGEIYDHLYAEEDFQNMLCFSFAQHTVAFLHDQPLQNKLYP